jgi:hypothetical protein
MTVGEYEERFRRPASSWHQILTLTQDPIQTRRRRWRCLIATALLAVMTLTIEIASHHTAHSPFGEASARQPALDVLPNDFWRILDRGRSGWTDRNPPGPDAQKMPLARAHR